MAEVIGLAASLIQIAGAGVQLSTSLYNFVGSANRAESDIADIADDVQITASTLDSVGKVFEREGGTCVVSKKAIQDAESLIKRCEAVFGEIQQMIEKRRKTGKDGKKLSTAGKFSWPMKEPRVDLSRKRLESLKTSLQLLLQVILLANGQAKGNLEQQTLEEERKRVRELHRRQQASLKALQALENKLDQVSLSEDETLYGSKQPSRVPTIDLLVNTSNLEPRVHAQAPNLKSPKPLATSTTYANDTEPSESEGTLSDDGNEQISASELTQCAGHVQKLLERIHDLQRNIDDATSAHAYPRHRVHKLYRRFCRKFESEMAKPNSGTRVPIAPLPDFLPPSGKSTYTLSKDKKSEVNNNHAILPGRANLQTGALHHVDKAEDLRRLSTYGGHDRSQFSEPKARSDAPSRGSSKESFQNAFAEDDDQAPQGPGEVYRTKTGRISKAKKGLKVHSCECGKSYTRAEHLRRHQKNHTSDDVVQCNLCGKTFYRRDLLERHIGRHKERHTSHDDDADRAEPESTTSTFNYTWTLQPLPIQGVAVSSTSSDAKELRALPPPSNLRVHENLEHSDAYPEGLVERNGPIRFSRDSLLPNFRSSSNSTSPQSAITQTRYGSDGRPHRPIFAPSLPSSYQTYSRPTPFSVPLPAVPGRNDARASGQNTDAGGYASPLTTPNAAESTVTSDAQKTRLDPKIHHSGFTPVNSTQTEWADPVQGQNTNPTIRRGRTKPLSSDQRALASQMRSISACVNCKQLKQKCDTEVPCTNCRKHALRSDHLPEPTCRGQTLTDLSENSKDSDLHSIVPRVNTGTAGGSKNGVDKVRHEEDLARNPTPATATPSHSTPTDEVLQRLVEEAGSDKRLESSRADRKAFFDIHWAFAPRAGLEQPSGKRGYQSPPRPSNRASRPDAPDDPKAGATRDYGLRDHKISESTPRTPLGNESTNAAANTILDASESADVDSPPPEPADKTSEEWISWKRARLSEGTRKGAKRKRGGEDEAGDPSSTSPIQQQIYPYAQISPSQSYPLPSMPNPKQPLTEYDNGPKPARATAGSNGPETKTHQRKKSKIEHISSTNKHDSQEDVPRNTGPSDHVMGEGAEEEKDIVDLLLEQWTVPV